MKQRGRERHVVVSFLLVLFAATGFCNAQDATSLPKYAVRRIGRPPKRNYVQPPSLEFLDGQLVAAYFHDRVELHDVARSKKLLVWATPGTKDRQVSVDGRYGIAHLSTDVWELFELNARKAPVRLQRFIPPEFSEFLKHLEVRDGRMLTVTNHSIQVWDIATGRQLWNRPARSFIGSRTRLGQIVALTGEQEISVFDSGSGTVVSKFTLASCPSVDEAQSPLVLLADERHLVGPSRKETGAWIVVDLEAEAELDKIDRSADAVTTLALNSDGSRTVTVGFDRPEVLVNEWPSGKLLHRIVAPAGDKYRFFHTERVRFADDDTVLLIRHDAVWRLDLKTTQYGKYYAPWAAPADPPADFSVQAATFAGERDVVTVTPTRLLRVHRSTGETTKAIRVPGRLRIRGVYASPDASFVAVHERGPDPDNHDITDDDDKYIARLHVRNLAIADWATIEIGLGDSVLQYVDQGRAICVDVVRGANRMLGLYSASGDRLAEAIAPRHEGDEPDAPPRGDFSIVGGDRILWLAADGSRYVLDRKLSRFVLHDRLVWKEPGLDYEDELRLPGGRVAIKGGEIRDLRTGIHRLRLDLTVIQRITPLRGGRLLLIAGCLKDDVENHLHLVDAITGQVIHSFPYADWPELQLSADNTYVAARYRHVVTVWDLAAIMRDAVTERESWTSEQAASAWSRLRHDGFAVRSLVEHPREALAHAKRLLRPAAKLDEQRATRLLKQLESEDSELRVSAFAELRQFDSRLQPIAKRHLPDARSSEAKRLVNQLLAAFEAGHPEDIYASRIAETLYYLRSDPVIVSDAKLRLQPMAILSRLSHGPPGAPLTIAADRALHDIEHSK